jgi:hypothetical protein
VIASENENVESSLSELLAGLLEKAMLLPVRKYG